MINLIPDSIEKIEDFFKGENLSLPLKLGAFDYPASNLYRQENALVFEAAVPGVDKDSLSVEIKDGYLTLSGSAKEKKEEKKKDYFLKQISEGSFFKRIFLSDGLDEKEAKAELKDGILKVIIPFSEEKKEAKKIPIEQKT